MKPLFLCKCHQHFLHNQFPCRYDYDEHVPSFQELDDPVEGSATTVIYFFKINAQLRANSIEQTYINTFINTLPSIINGVVYHIALANWKRVTQMQTSGIIPWKVKEKRFTAWFNVLWWENLLAAFVSSIGAVRMSVTHVIQVEAVSTLALELRIRTFRNSLNSRQELFRAV